MMKAVVSTHYGSPDVLQIREVPKPVPTADEILIKVYATTVSRTDCGTLRAHPPLLGRAITGLLRPKCTILGMDFAGVVDAVGAGVELFTPGDRVFGMSPDNYGAHAQFLRMPETGTIATMPAHLNFAEVVVCEGAWYANTYLQRFGLASRHKILIYGASGAIGTSAVQLAKHYGAHVTAVVATRHVALVRSLGADEVIDYTAQDFTKIGARFDFVFDAVGKTTFGRCRRLLKPGGSFSAADLGPFWQNALLAIGSALIGSNRVVMPTPKSSKAFVEKLRDLMQAGQFHAVVDRGYSLDAIVDAYRYVETAQKTGIVVINVRADDQPVGAL